MIRELLVATLLLGCSTQPDPQHCQATWTVSNQFDDAQVATIVSAADAWRTATNGRVSWTVQVGTAPVRAPWTITPAQGVVPTNLGETNADRDAITLDTPNIPAECLWTVAAHELGHALYLDHREGGVMDTGNGWQGCPTAITTDDVAQFNEIWGADE